MSEEATPQAGSPDVAADAAPAVSFLDTLPEDLRGEPSLRNFNDVGALAKSYTHAQRMIGGDEIGSHLNAGQMISGLSITSTAAGQRQAKATSLSWTASLLTAR